MYNGPSHRQAGGSAGRVLKPWFDLLSETGFAADIFLAGLAEDVVWTATGSSPVSGTFVGKPAYLAGVYQKLDRKLQTWPKPVVEGLLTDGDQGVVWFRGEGGVGNNGCDYSMRYCWVMRVAEGRVSEVVGYYDTAKVNELFDEPLDSPAPSAGEIETMMTVTS